MLVCFTFQAKPGKEEEFKALLNNPDGGRAVAQAMGAIRNTLFLSGNRMVRIFDFPDGHRPPSLADLAKNDAALAAFLRKLGPLIVDGFDLDVPGSLAAFNQRAAVALVYDVRP